MSRQSSLLILFSLLLCATLVSSSSFSKKDGDDGDGNEEKEWKEEEEWVSESSSGYDVSMGISNMNLAKISGCDKNDILSWTCKPCSTHAGMKDVQLFTNSSLASQAFIGYDSKSNNVVLAIRGSKELMNWLEDFNFILFNYTNFQPNCRSRSSTHDDDDEDTFRQSSMAISRHQHRQRRLDDDEDDEEKDEEERSSSVKVLGAQQDCEVHLGFYSTYQSLVDAGMRDGFIQLLKKYPSAKNIVITGHSLGAAVATLTAVELLNYLPTQQIKFPPFIVYTFGCPRVGNAAFVSWTSSFFRYNNSSPSLSPHVHFRVTHHQDPVPHLPPVWMLGYLHVPHEIHFHDDSNHTFVDCTDTTNNEDMTKLCAHGELPINGNDHDRYVGISSKCDVE